MFCQRMVNDYINYPSQDKADSIPIEEPAKELGIKL